MAQRRRLQTRPIRTVIVCGRGVRVQNTRTPTVRARPRRDGSSRRAPRKAEWDALIQAVDAFAPIDTTDAHVRRALQVQRLLAQRNQRGRKIPDLLVAAAGEEHGLTILHYDGDFDLIAAVTGQQCRWVVPAGTAD